MTAALVRLDYQGLTVSFNEDGWFDATAAAAHYGKRPVLYCVIFAHGLMKIGATSNMPERLKALSAHGLLKPLFAEILIESCESRNLFDAEREALVEISKISEMVGKEVFRAISIQTVKDIFVAAIHRASTPLVREYGPKDFDEIAEESGMYRAFYRIAKDVRTELSEKEAIDFVLLNTPENGEIDEHRWRESVDNLHPFSLELIPLLGVKNATLIGRGVGYPDRKKILESTALEARVMPFPKIAA